MKKFVRRMKKKYKGGYCEICHKNFTRQENFRKHNEKKHKVQGGKGMYMLLQGVISKVKKTTGPSKQNICYLCINIRKFYSKSTLKKHIKTRHNGEIDQIKTDSGYIKLTTQELENRKMVCKICRAQYVCIQELELHMINDHEIAGIHHCKQCDKYFKKKQTLNDHIRRVHGPKLHICSQCNSTFSTVFNLNRHQRNHFKRTAKQDVRVLSKRQQDRRWKGDGNEIQGILDKNPIMGKSIILKKTIKK